MHLQGAPDPNMVPIQKVLPYKLSCRA